MPKLKGIIFDLDGTLVDSAPDLRQALNKTLVEEGHREVSINEVKQMVGDGMLAMLQRAFSATGNLLPIADSKRVLNKFLLHYSQQPSDPSQLYPYVAETLVAYKRQGIKLGLCTNKQEEATMRLVKELGLIRVFDFIAGGDSFPMHKPHPGHVTGVISRLAVPVSSCVMVGDSTNDVLAAHGAEIPCIVVTQGYGRDWDQLGADALISSFIELPAALRKVGFQ